MTALHDEDRARGQVYALLGHLLAGPPDAALLESLRGVAPEPGDRSLLAASWEMLAVAAARANLEELRHEYDALFIGLGRGEVVPYGSWYLTGFLMEQPLAQLRGDLRALGIERQAGVHEPEDHVSSLCETMRFLIAVQQRPLGDQKKFFEHFLYRGAIAFCDAVSASDKARFYRHVAAFTRAFLEVEREAFEIGG